MGTSNFPKIAFIGLGVMGREMVRHLITAGYPVKIYDISSDAISALAEQGGTASDSVATAVCDAQIVISMLPNTPQVEEVVYRDGIIDHMPGGGIYIDMSTISPEATRAMASALAAKSIFMLDGPVSGGPIGAKNAALSIMVGGERAAFERAEKVFKVMGATVTHVGAPGAGQTVKLCNQLVCAVNIQAVCEALALGRASGVDLDQMRDVLLGGSASSWMLDKLGPAMIAGDTSAGFRIDLMLKDLRLVLEMAGQKDVPLPATSLVTSQYVEARAHGEGSNGNQALFRVYDRMTGQNLPRHMAVRP
ncbi:NAD(P)-dependent oxidoreductase [Brucella intermedia]|uniref:2-hydroxy-3-oxopropionate reductase n=4 Tax=Brucella intermedia TaxID=94625 RepID=A0ABR6AW91_9HYPH|nr:NAD(P)-dependent oxidoreductase [Brucella intermedia]EEQ92895.1 2-hydroxy-3-oxopropionate reductase [Brucella intermedia LMG 3301]ELT48182.1 2-hydroxy-3-oxopropionate reductase [Brucella intermedia M86]KAB2705940.1 NAD(P)-dependent oxidoreductase [Brucella intermedia]MBA8853745.1 2-hydroxy-3-oxopropionate reductase [Brucella intermedia]MDH0124229.1 NAD(P)-dependent oxidoreductase [Brucella intermedia GD04153]